MSEWIKCREKMPDEGQECIVQTHSGLRYVAFYESHSGLFFDVDFSVEYISVTHWMPLPSPPED